MAVLKKFLAGKMGNSTLDGLLYAFYTIARGLNDEFGVYPVLYGSLGLSRLTGININPDDIDILLPAAYLGDDFGKMSNFMAERGYKLIDLHEHIFESDGVLASFAVNDLSTYVRIESDHIPIIAEGGSSFHLPTLYQYLIIYEKSLRDSYRRNKNNSKDAAKINLIKRLMEDA
jgi:hypothetical protein